MHPNSWNTTSAIRAVSSLKARASMAPCLNALLRLQLCLCALICVAYVAPMTRGAAVPVGRQCWCPVMFAEGLGSGTESGVPAAAAGGPWITPCACSGVSTHQCRELVTRGTVCTTKALLACTVLQQQRSRSTRRQTEWCADACVGSMRHASTFMHLLLNPPPSPPCC